MRKILTLIGTRPEIIKLSCVIQELDTHTQQIIVHTGQNYDYELNQIFFNELQVRKPDYFLNAVGASSAETIGRIIAELDKVLEAEKPDAILIYGDTNSGLGVIPAKRRKIPIFHMEAGNRCFDMRVPEEINRKIIDHTSDINIVITEHARRNLLMEGIRTETIFKVGSSMPEVYAKYRNSIESSLVLKNLGLVDGKFFLVSAHREENVDSEARLKKFLESLDALTEDYQFDVVVSTHPRTRSRLERFENYNSNERIKFLKPFGFFDYIKLQKSSACVISDSGTITEESSLLGFSAITIRYSHERPEGFDEGTLLMCGLNPERVLESVKIAMSHGIDRQSKVVQDYEAMNVSRKVLKIILSYIDYVNENTWRNISM